MKANVFNHNRKSSDEMPEIFSIGGNQKRTFITIKSITLFITPET